MKQRTVYNQLGMGVLFMCSILVLTHFVWADQDTETYELSVPLGLDIDDAEIPYDNPITAKKVLLGKMLYFEPRMSQDNTVSCATCHAPHLGFSDGRPTSKGIAGQVGGRNAPTVINRIFSTHQFWDGRAASLEEQALGPITNPIEMGMPSMPMAIEKIAAIEGYRTLFQEVFGTEINKEGVAAAIAAFERTLISGNSPFDRYEAGETRAMSQSAQRGMTLFFDEKRTSCAVCHAGQNFTDESFRNIGVGLDRAEPDLGRYNVTLNWDDLGKFKVPTLRDVAKSGPYMHDGQFESLMDVVNIYDEGGRPNPTLDPLIKPLNLTEQEKEDLVAFLESLTGDMQPMELPELPQQ